jgi:hypothetical protein
VRFQRGNDSAAILGLVKIWSKVRTPSRFWRSRVVVTCLDSRFTRWTCDSYVARVNELAARHPRYGYRRIWALLRTEG